jgi:hypothetical protein
MKSMLALSAFALLVAAAPASKGNPQINFPGFAALTSDVGAYRQQRLVDLKQFQSIAARNNSLIPRCPLRRCFRPGPYRRGSEPALDRFHRGQPGYDHR